MYVYVECVDYGSRMLSPLFVLAEAASYWMTSLRLKTVHPLAHMGRLLNCIPSYNPPLKTRWDRRCIELDRDQSLAWFRHIFNGLQIAQFTGHIPLKNPLWALACAADEDVCMRTVNIYVHFVNKEVDSALLWGTMSQHNFGGFSPEVR